MVSTDATEGDRLVLDFQVVEERLGLVGVVISMITFDGHTMLVREAFELILQADSLTSSK